MLRHGSRLLLCQASRIDDHRFIPWRGTCSVTAVGDTCRGKEIRFLDLPPWHGSGVLSSASSGACNNADLQGVSTRGAGHEINDTLRLIDPRKNGSEKRRALKIAAGRRTMDFVGASGRPDWVTMTARPPRRHTPKTTPVARGS